MRPRTNPLSGNKSPVSSRVTRRLICEALENRRLLAVDFLVTNTADSGAGSLRNAILLANSANDSAIIKFQIPTSDPGFVDVDSNMSGGDSSQDVFRMRPSLPLPVIQNARGFSIVVDGMSQNIWAGDTNALGPEIELDGTLTSAAWGVQLGSRSRLSGFTIHSFDQEGVLVNGTETIVSGNYIGTDPTGTAALGNRSGISLTGANLQVLGNLVSGNADEGIAVYSADTVSVFGNRVGTNQAGDRALRNGREGIYVGGTNVQVGGSSQGLGNLVSGNSNGIVAAGSNISIKGNKVGTNAAGDAAIPNSFSGILVGVGASQVVVGGADSSDGNLVSGNEGDGIFVWEAFQITVRSNRVGVAADGLAPLPNLHSGVDIQGGRRVTIVDNVIANNSLDGVEVRSGEDGLKVVNWSNSSGGNNHYYALIPYLDWFAANTLAQQLGGTLADVLDANENAFLVAQFGADNPWIGASDFANEGTFVWSSGAPFQYSSFSQFEPNGGTRENHVELNNGNWNDLPFDFRRKAVVEFTSEPSLELLRSKLTGVEVRDSRVLDNGRSGVSVTAVNEVPVTIRGNAIFNNSALGIDLEQNGVSSNDAGDIDDGPNHLQNFPVLSLDESSSPAELRGTLRSAANTIFEIDVYLNPNPDPSLSEGELRIFQTTVQTDANGTAIFTVPRQTHGTQGFVTATATNTQGETSEFSPSIPVLTNGPVIVLSSEGQVLTSGQAFSLGATKPGSPVNRTVTVRNFGDENLLLQPVTAQAGFSVLSNFVTNQVVPPGGTADLILQFDAAAEGSFSARVDIDSNAGVLSLNLGASAYQRLTLLKDLNPGLANSIPNSMIPLNGAIYFLADDGVHGEELWKTDGTPAGTQLVKDVEAGSESSFIEGLVVVNGGLLFRAFTEANGSQLWRSDGTASGTLILKDFGINAELELTQGSNPNARESSNQSVAYFSFDSGSGNDYELWKTDGTLAGTTLVAEINPGNFSYPGSFHAVGDLTYFSAINANGHRELWVTDGTASGTARVLDGIIGENQGTTTPFSRMASLNGKLVTQIISTASGAEMWTSDGTPSGTQIVIDIRPGAASSNPLFLDSIGNQLLFYANDGTVGNELWITDGTDAGTRLVKDINPGTEDGLFSVVSQDAGNRVYFFANGGTAGRELWVSDGSSNGTQQVLDLNPGASNSVTNLRGMSRLGSKLIFGGTDGRVGEELWMLDLSETDVTSPTSRVDALPTRQSNKSFVVRVTGSDGVPSNPLETISNVASYDLFVAEGNGAFTKFATVSSNDPQTIFTGRSNTTYFFRSVARDAAGNTEHKSVAPEATTYVPDLDSPTTSVESVTADSPNFQLSIRGSDSGGSGLSHFRIFVAVDNGVATQLGEVNAGQSDNQGVHRATVNYQAMVDGVSHSYRFFSQGIDREGNVEAIKITGDITVRRAFEPATQLRATGIDVQLGQKQRSFVRYVDLQFGSDSGLQAILDTLNDSQASNDRIKLQRFNLDGSGFGDSIALQGTATRDGRTLQFNFGSNGLGGNPNSTAGNGYYRLSVDTTGDGLADQTFHFYRILGDTNSDRIVNTLDVRDIALAISRRVYDPNLDVNGDGVIDLRDRALAIGQINVLLSSNLPLDD